VTSHDVLLSAIPVAAPSVDTVRGTVRSCWTRNGHVFDLQVTVPANATATVSVPLFSRDRRAVHADRGATLVRVQNGVVVYSVGSGNWTFTTGRG
jgi:alpha-L-rhamnosidase